MMLKVGFIGWRGMVGSVLMQRMMEENDFALIEPQFFTTSQVGSAAPNVGKDSGLKVQASIQGDEVRVNGAKRDLLQDAIAFCKKNVTDFPLQFGNFRD